MRKNISRILITFFLLGTIILFLLHMINSPIKESGNEKTHETIDIIPSSSYNTTWIDNGIPICTEQGSQFGARICSDNNGGMIIIWMDGREGGRQDIYAQRVDSNGNIQWSTSAIPISTGYNGWLLPEICSDGTGGAIIVWEDDRNGESDIFCQRINSNGEVQWTLNGISICTAINEQHFSEICSDGSGGAIIAWEDERNGGYYKDLYTQRIDHEGNIKWIVNGTPIYTLHTRIFGMRICSDGERGAIIAWADERSGEYDIYAQKIDLNGNSKWNSNGTPICTELGTQYTPKVCSDGKGGAIFTWQDKRKEDGYVTYAQKVDSNSNIKWIPNGTIIYNVSGFGPYICSDDNGGAIIICSSSGKAYIQRINSEGNLMWVDNNPINLPLYSHSLCSDEEGGAVIAFLDSTSPDNRNAYTQRISANGDLLWEYPALPICKTGYCDSPLVYCDGIGNSFFVWSDYRISKDRGDTDLYSQHIKYEVLSNQDQAIPTGNFHVIIIFIGITSLVIINKSRISQK